MISLPYVRLAIAGVIVTALAAGTWKVYHNGKVSGRAQVQTLWDAEKNALVELANRTRDIQAKANQKVDNDYQQVKNRIAAGKRATDERLRDYQAAAADSSTAASTSGGDDPNPRIASECVAALVVLDGYAKELAGKAGALQGYTREVCLGK